MSKIKSKKLNLNFFFNSFLLVSILFLGSLCVKSVDDLMSITIELQEVREKKDLVVGHNLDLEILTSELQSHGNVASRVGDLKMVKVQQVEYIVVAEEVLARR